MTLTGCVCWAAYAAIAVLSRRFVFGEGFSERPILAVLGLLGVAFGCYLAALWIAVGARDDRRLLGIILVASVVFRGTLVFSRPIQEVDIYRYLWDGAVTAAGVSPFRYSPEQVLGASTDEAVPHDLHRLAEVRDGSPALATILSDVHYGELPTVYPPVSQAVFALCAVATPPGATVFQHVVIMKGCFAAFDLVTLAAVIGLLRLARQHTGWAVAYGWCPLVIKEIANSGHLDAVAVCLTSLAVLAAFYGMIQSRFARGLGAATLASILLAAAVGAKLYPVVLMPLLAATWVRRLGWRAAAVPSGAFAAVVLAVLWPMLPRPPGKFSAPAAAEETTGKRPPVPASSRGQGERPAAAQDPSLGLRTFLGRWEMNDFLFMLVVENLKPAQNQPPAARPWFAVVPESWREAAVAGPVRRLGVPAHTAAFLVTRIVTGAVFLVLAAIFAWHATRREAPVEWLRSAFLTLAWFWLLLPTQNPWYWIWAMPLVVFARSRAWLLLSGLTLVYYLRFWLGYHWPEEAVLGTGYPGKLFFDFIVTWLEFGPWFVMLSIRGWGPAFSNSER